MRLSVVVVNWNSREDLAGCLDALRAQTHDDLEVIVVDNGSTDGSAEMVRERFPAVRLLALPENVGFAEGCNRGIAASTGSWVAMLNNDTIAEPGWASALVAAARVSDPRCGMLQSVLLFLEPEGTVNSTGIVLDRAGSGHDRYGGARFDEQIGCDEIFCPTAGAAAYRRAMLDAVQLPTGWFDRDHFMYSEDLDLGWRARLAGWTAQVVRDAVVRHKHMGSASRKGRDWIVVVSRTNRLRTLLKNASPEFFVRSLPRTAWEVAEILWHGGPKAGVRLPAVVVESLLKRSHVSELVAEDRRVVEERWIGR